MFMCMYLCVDMCVCTSLCMGICVEGMCVCTSLSTGVCMCVMWDSLLYMCCFYWLMNKEAAWPVTEQNRPRWEN